MVNVSMYLRFVSSTLLVLSYRGSFREDQHGAIVIRQRSNILERGLLEFLMCQSGRRAVLIAVPLHEIYTIDPAV